VHLFANIVGNCGAPDVSLFFFILSRLAALSAREADVAERQKAIDKRERACKSLEKELKQR